MDDRIEKLISSMTLQEKIGQLNQEIFDPENMDEMKEKVRNSKVGSLILAGTPTAGNDEQPQLETDKINELSRIAIEESETGIPVIFGRDVIHGHKTVLPIPLALAASFDMDLIYEGYKAVAKEAANDGVQWTFAPMLDISRDPRWGRCIEGAGEDPYLASEIAKSVISAFREEGIATCAKHYIGYGASDGGRDYGNSEISDYTLRNNYLKPFKAAVDAGVETVMNSFNTIGGQTTSSSRYLLRNVLKNELGFKGFVISDWWAILQLISQHLAKNKKEAARIALTSGVDMDMVDGFYADCFEELLGEGKISEDDINEAVRRVLYIKNKVGLFENPYSKYAEIDIEKHNSIAEKCSDEAIVLLKNSNNILPLDKKCKAVVTGPFAFERRSHLGSWVLDGDVNRVETVASAIKNKAPYSILPSSEYLWDDCLIDLPFSDAVIVVLGESHRVTGEANSLSDIDLPEEQLDYVKKLHKAGRPVIGVMCFGRPIALEKAEKYFDAIIYAWHCGTKAAQSIAKILFGEVNPSGKLPMTFPRTTAQVPIYYNYYPCGRNAEFYYKEETEIWRAYRDLKNTPLYPFGYGLSYSEFEYADIICNAEQCTLEELKLGKKFEICTSVKNIGKCDGKETTQCYVQDLSASVARPIRELKAFSKNYISKNEQIDICFEIGYKELGFYNEQGEFVVEPGEFDIYVGGDSHTENKITINVN